mmetsp:Transcript_93573/g.202334  ORF Transcript_93573/g.202334 Transcript_93573/m.202334 type:complete len:439 (+) Transcript_93573:43-1359(+)
MRVIAPRGTKMERYGQDTQDRGDYANHHAFGILAAAGLLPPRTTSQLGIGQVAQLASAAAALASDDASLGAAINPRVCVCGHLVEPESRFCRICGARCPAAPGRPQADAQAEARQQQRPRFQDAAAHQPGHTGGHHARMPREQVALPGCAGMQLSRHQRDHIAQLVAAQSHQDLSNDHVSSLAAAFAANSLPLPADGVPQRHPPRQAPANPAGAHNTPWATVPWQILRQLTDEDLERTFEVKPAESLGESSAQVLWEHFQRYGRVSRVLIMPNMGETEDMSVAYVLAHDVETAGRVVAAGQELNIAGQLLTVQAVHPDCGSRAFHNINHGGTPNSMASTTSSQSSGDMPTTAGGNPEGRSSCSGSGSGGWVQKAGSSGSGHSSQQGPEAASKSDSSAGSYSQSSSGGSGRARGQRVRQARPSGGPVGGNQAQGTPPGL